MEVLERLERNLFLLEVAREPVTREDAEPISRFCESLVRVAAACHLPKPIGAEILRCGAEASIAGLRAAIECSKLWNDKLDEAQVNAVLSGIANQADDLGHAEVVAAIDAMRRAVPPLHQLGALALSGAISLAEDVAPLVGVKGKLPLELFNAARKVHKPRLVEKRLRYAEAWSGRSRATDGVALRSYITELKAVKTEDRLRLVVESILRYFPEKERVPHRGDLRSAVFSAMERLEPIRADALRTALETARLQLGLETPGTQAKVGRFFGRIFS